MSDIRPYDLSYEELEQECDAHKWAAESLATQLALATSEPRADLLRVAYDSCPWGSRGTVDCAEFGPRECDGVKCGDAT